MTAPIRREALRFLIAGGSTTLASYAIYLALLSVAGHRLSYATAFVLGIFWSYSVNTFFVFHQPWSFKKLIRFPLVYLVQYAISAILLETLINWLGVSERLAPLIVVALTLPLTFALVKRTLIPTQRDPTAKE